MSKDDFAKYSAEGYCTIPLAVYEELKAKDQEHAEILERIAKEDANIIVSTRGWMYHDRIYIKNPTDLIKNLEKERDYYKQQLSDLQQKGIPLLNLRKRKVNDL